MTESQFICETFSGLCLTDDESKNHMLVEEPSGGILTGGLHVFSDSVFGTSPSCVGLQPVLQNLENRRRSSHEQLHLSRKKRHFWRGITLNGTCVLETHRCRYCTSYKSSCPRTCVNPRGFKIESSLRARLTTSPIREESGQRERSGHSYSKIQACLLVVRCSRIGTDLQIQ